jgi:hypothetical protein
MRDFHLVVTPQRFNFGRYAIVIQRSENVLGLLVRNNQVSNIGGRGETIAVRTIDRILTT